VPTYAEVVEALKEEVDNDAATSSRDLLLYVHIPFCSSKCTFCHWVAEIPVAQLRSGATVRAAYVEAVCEQIRAYGPVLDQLGYVPRLLYWGGGTPSILDPDEITRVADATATHCNLEHVTEMSVEASPETLTSAKLRAFRDAGFQRLSIGVQSFDDRELRTAGRAHDAAQGESAFRLAREEGFANINLDFIAGFPGQTAEMLGGSIEKCCELEPDHVTLYVYNDYGPTVMAKQMKSGKRPSPTRADRGLLFQQGKALLLDAGYVEYMPLYFARADSFKFVGEEYYFSLQGDHFGFGSGAHSSLAHHLFVDYRGNLKTYVEHPADLDFGLRYGPDSQTLKLILKRFSGLDWIDYDLFQDRFGFAFTEVREDEVIRNWEQWMFRRGAELVETSRGIAVVWPDGSPSQMSIRGATAGSR
jgi:oxygen-independent coproporphyrinogen-3 oxidase